MDSRRPVTTGSVFTVNDAVAQDEPPCSAQDVLDALEDPAGIVAHDGTVLAVNTSWTTFSVTNDGDLSRAGVGANYLTECDRAAARSTGRDRVDAAAAATGLRAVLAGHPERFHHDYPCHAPGVERWFSVRVSPVMLANGTGAVIRYIDTSPQHVSRAALERQALHDTLTGLPNRLLLLDRLRQATVQGRARDRLLGVAVLDLDDFHQVNDTHGHEIGDETLKVVAERLTNITSSDALVARTSGDEFAIVWHDLTDPADLTARLELVRDELSRPVAARGATVHLSLSVGTAVGRPWDDGRDLLLEAGAELGAARPHRRGLVRASALGLRAGTELGAARELDRALERRELVLHYQPVVDLATGLPHAVEALVRWQHPDRGLLPPDQFIPLAEQTGQIIALSGWVLERACRDAADPDGPLGKLNVAVNLSACQLAQPDLVDTVQGVLTGSGLDPARLTLEVTESAMMTDEIAAQRSLEGLVRLGVTVAIDDFGTGFSSLLYVRRFPVRVLKLDRTFVAGIGSSASDEAICACVVRLARSIGAICIAEGVESANQLALLRSLGCQQGQGWLWAPAVPLDALSRVLKGITADAHAPVAAAQTNPPVQLLPEVARQIDELDRAGASPHTIAAALNRSGARHPAGLRWGSQAVVRYLTS